MGRLLTLTLLSLAITILCNGSSSAQHLENDLQSLLNDMNVNHYANAVEGDDDFEVELFFRPDGETSDGKNSQRAGPLPSPTARNIEGVRRLWGVADTETPIGRLFSYPIPNDAFEGSVVRYQVKGLPSWLHWDSHRGVVEGIPRPADRGHHYVTIKAIGKDDSIAKDVFSVDVIEMSGNVMARPLGCRPKEDLSIMSIVLDTHLPTMDSKSRVKLLRSATKFLGVKELSLMSAPRDFDPLADDAAILAGPGSARIGIGGRRSESMSQLQWPVGCVGEVSKNQQAFVDRAESTAKSGELEKALNVPVIGWHITQINPASKRVRRQADYSGDYLDYEYNYDYSDYDTSDGELIPDYNEPETRVIPSLLTPSFPDATATYAPGNAGAYPDRPVEYSPVLRPVPMSTPVYIPVKPTRVVEASPTVTYESAYPTDVYPDLEGSMVTHPSTVVESTTPLTYTTTSSKPAIPTKPIEATSVPTVAVTTETGVKNFPPRVINRIKKLAWIAGHVYHLQVPRETFEDTEDGDTSHLRLMFRTPDGLTVGRNSWIQFNPTRQEIYALPLEENIGRYTYILEAMDSEGKTASETVMIHVQQARHARNYNHRFTATIKLEKKFEYDFVYSLDWQIKAVEKIASAYQDDTTDNINVRSITNNPVKLTWTNTSLTDPKSAACPSDELEALAEVVLAGDGHDMTREIKQAFQPEFHIKHIHLHYLGPCEKHSRPPPIDHAVPKVPVEGEIDGEDFNTKPIIRNQIDYLDVPQGSLYRFQVPPDTCYDLEDGDSSRLRMRLLLSTSLAPPPLNSWLQFDTANQEFFGIPLEDDVGKKEYLLECVDSEGDKVTDALFVNVIKRESTKIPPVEFSMKIDTKYEDFIKNAHQKARLIERIGKAFNDSDAKQIEIDSFRKGSVVVTWYNLSLPADPCPNEEIMELKKVMVDHNGNLLQEFINKFSPEFTVTNASIRPTGSCLGEDTPTHIEEETHDPPVEEKVEGEENDYLLNFIIPAVIIAAMLLLAAIIACCLYRRRRYGKMTMADDRTFVSKGIPIIFAEELDDRPDPAKSPVIMKDEKPPLPPPEYQRGSSPAASSTPPTSDRRRPTSDVADDAPSYQPPPPFTATNGASRHPRPNMPPTYRKPPTYVPP